MGTRWMQNQIPHPISCPDWNLSKNTGRYVENKNTKSSFFHSSSKINKYYFNYYFIIFLKRPILDPKFPLMTLSYFINTFSIEVSSNKRNRKTNPWYDKDCKSAMKEIKESFDDSLKTDKIKIYIALTKRKKCSIFVEDKKIYYTSLRCLLRNFGSRF